MQSAFMHFVKIQTKNQTTHSKLRILQHKIYEQLKDHQKDFKPKIAKFPTKTRASQFQI
jgi:hypothetical protein